MLQWCFGTRPLPTPRAAGDAAAHGRGGAAETSPAQAAPTGKEFANGRAPNWESFVDVLTHRASRWSPSRWATSLGKDADITAAQSRRKLQTICAFAAAAECFNTVAMPSIEWRDGTDLTGTMCNILGAWFCGFACGLAILGPNARLVADVFSGGFVAAYTSFCHAAENSVAWHCARSPNALLYLATALLSGPISFGVGRTAGSIISFSRIAAAKKKTDDEAEPSQEEQPSNAMLRAIRNILVLFIIASVSLEYVWNGAEAGVSLATGVCFTVVAIALGDEVAFFAEWMAPEGSQVSWPTIVSNFFALCGVVLCQLLGPWHNALVGSLPEHGWFLDVLAAKMRSCFCGALSAYGAFSEDTAGKLMEGHIDAAAANVGMNSFIAMIFVAALGHVTCPHGVMA